jgi:hypothetical protein
MSGKDFDSISLAAARIAFAIEILQLSDTGTITRARLARCRWRLFAIAAWRRLAKGQQEVALYAARLRARRAGVSTPRGSTGLGAPPQFGIGG